MSNEDNKFQLNYEMIKSLLKGVIDPNNTIRTEAEDKLFQIRNSINLYSILLEIFSNSLESNFYKKQSIIILKNILKPELNINRSRLKILDEESSEVKEICIFLKRRIIEIIANSYDNIYDNTNNIIDLISILSDKYFPDDWEYFFFLLDKVFKMEINEIFLSIKLTLITLKMLYNIIKQHLSKKTISSKSKYFKVKNILNNNILVFFNNINYYYLNNLFNNTQDESMIYLFLDLLQITDKVFIIMIEAGFNMAELYKDDSVVKMLVLSVNKTEVLLQNIIQFSNLYGKNNKIVELLNKNFYKNLEKLGKLLSNQTAQLVFYANLDKYIKIMFYVVKENKSFNQETLKIVLLSLYKILSTDYFKENTNININQSNSSYDKYMTPEKKTSNTFSLSNKSYNLISPIKFKNYEKEVSIASETFLSNFNQESVLFIFNIIINEVPINFNLNYDKDEGNEIENLNDKEEELNINSYLDIFDVNNLTFKIIYKETIKSFLINFKSYLVDYTITNIINKMFDIVNQQIDFSQNKNLNYILAIVTLINIFPSLYENHVINQTQIIDYQKYFQFLEGLVKQNYFFISCYLQSIYKWTDVLISYDIIHFYINTISNLLNNISNKYILVEALLTLEGIIIKIDSYLSSDEKKFIFNTTTDISTLITKIKSNINWSNLLIVSTKICFDVLVNDNFSAEIITQMIKLLTMLIEKCHFQCDGAILLIIKNSKLNEIIMNCNEITRTNLNEMFKVLLFTFPNSGIILETCLLFIENSFTFKIDLSSLNMLLFFLKVIDISNSNCNSNDLNQYQKISNYEDSIELNNCIKKSSQIALYILDNYSNNYSNHIIFQIIEELFYIGAFNNEDTFKVLLILKERLRNVQQLYFDNINLMAQEEYDNDIVNPLVSSSSSGKKRYSFSNSNSKKLDHINSDILEYKTSLVNLFSIFLLKNQNIQVISNSNNIKIDSIFNDIVCCLYPDILVTSNHTIMYNSALVNLFNRSCCLDYNFFFTCLSNYIIQQNTTFNNNFSLSDFLKKWFIKMDSTISNEVRKLCILTICLILPNLNKESFIYLRYEIFQICLNIVHSELLKKQLSKKTNEPYLLSNNIQENKGNIKTMLLQQSIRSKTYHKNDFLLKVDIHELFINKFQEALMKYGLTYQYVIENLIDSQNISSRLNEIMGIKKIEDTNL